MDRSDGNQPLLACGPACPGFHPCGLVPALGLRAANDGVLNARTWFQRANPRAWKKLATVRVFFAASPLGLRTVVKAFWAVTGRAQRLPVFWPRPGSGSARRRPRLRSF